MKSLTIDHDGEKITIERSERATDSNANADHVLRKNKSGRSIMIALFSENSQFASTVVVLDGQHRDGREESQIDSAIEEALADFGYTRRSAENQTESAINNFSESLKNR
jgi:hypothetical protein